MMGDYESALAQFLSLNSRKPAFTDSPGQLPGYMNSIEQRMDSGTMGRAQNKEWNTTATEFDNNLSVLKKMITNPSKKWDILNIYDWLNRQELDKELNRNQMGTAVDNDQLRQRENQYLLQVPPQLPEGYARDSSGGFSAYPKIKGTTRGRWM